MVAVYRATYSINNMQTLVISHQFTITVLFAQSTQKVLGSDCMTNKSQVFCAKPLPLVY